MYTWISHNIVSQLYLNWKKAFILYVNIFYNISWEIQHFTVQLGWLLLLKNNLRTIYKYQEQAWDLL